MRVGWAGKVSPVVHFEGPFGFACQDCSAYDSAPSKGRVMYSARFHASLTAHDVLAFEVI